MQKETKKPPRLIIRPATVIFFSLLILLDKSALSFLPLAAALCHELGHLAVMLMLGVPVRQVELTVFGAEIRTSHMAVGAAGAAAIYAAGAVANLLSAVGVLCIRPPTLEAEFFVVCSISLAFLNLLPIRTLDGGCILEIIVSHIAPSHMTVIVDVISSAALFFLWIAAVHLILVCGGNLSLMLFCLYLFVTLYLK